MFFGALGGVVISLKGVYDHHCNRGDWDDGFTLWHIGRPISGALTGLITVVLLLAINPTRPNEPVAYAIAFIFGTQERRFFNFLAEVAALVVRLPGDEQDNTLKAVSLTPLEGKQGHLVVIGGQGFREGATVTFGTANDMENAVVSKDGRIIARHGSGRRARQRRRDGDQSGQEARRAGRQVHLHGLTGMPGRRRSTPPNIRTK